ncbi:NUDIX hydrolase [Streptomyces sp. NBC_00986]|uniref:NUDIX hydrolase n=1 Tax=Streptomyces sp. NBC_00986 TaxID=2903702 RepID=UPI003864D64A|nr:NUDIX domain-containing protein [Streptomyces sp. NBC_00986]
MNGEDAAHGRVALAVVVDAGRVLLIRRAVAEGALLWALPGGKAEPEETVEDAAVREAVEEAGVVVEAVRVLGDRLHPDTGRHLVYVVCRLVSGAPEAVSVREVAEVTWASRSETRSLVPRGLYGPVQDYLDGALGD